MGCDSGVKADVEGVSSVAGNVDRAGSIFGRGGVCERSQNDLRVVSAGDLRGQ